tara:strand:- start:1324 stop:2301 length:978 start_codon:yes stop_codon:yes gene_type:complete
MIIYRKYNHNNDYESYKVFCENNFGKNCYQSKIEHIEWLESNPSHFINLAVNNNEILGCFHGFKAPVLLDNNVNIFYSLHDLMVDKEKGSQLGLKLMQEGILQDIPVILSGAIGRISRAYKRLGSIQFKSHWYRKFIITLNPFKFFFLNNNKLKHIQSSINYNLINNKEEGISHLSKSLIDLYKYNNDFSEKYFKWRFFQKDSPLTFFMSDDRTENMIIFSLGLRRVIPFLRIISVRKKDDDVLISMLRSVETFASKAGIPVILYSITEDSPPPKELNYNAYKEVPNSYIYSKKIKLPNNISINGFSTDLGFDSIFYRGINEKIK